ncbi:unnamed protein product [Paramecium sonneborni]|uniref:Uncharacterized protein n=1 Tax=Paramecium sonneborni TaxID=65129 RepID=A0A8S1QIA1_9CILI|nr:unnamed protein product [Paramecium sonneborni]
MQDPELYVRNFQEEISQRNKRKQPLLYPDDQRLHERPRVRKIEPPSQIISQSLLKNHSYAPDPLQNFTKPLINYSINSPSGKDPQRYNHNFLYLAQDNIFRKEPFNQNQKDYAPQRHSQQSNEQRINYQNVGNMLIGGDTQPQQQSQPQIQNSQMTQSQYTYPQQQQQQLYQYQQESQLYQPQQLQSQQQQLSQSQIPKQQQYQQSQHYQQYQVPLQNNQQKQQFSQQYQLYQAGTPNTFKLKSDGNSQPFNYYGSRALKNLDSTQIY